jgi:hypothetical protein
MRFQLMVFLSLMVPSCSAVKDDAADSGSSAVAPVLPDYASLLFSLDTFPSASVVNGALSRHQQAYLNISEGHEYLIDRLEVGLEGLKSAILVTPIANPTTADAWIWDVKFQIDSTDYVGSMKSTTLSSGEIQFELKISGDVPYSSNCCEDFVWMSGTKTNEQEGAWIFFDPYSTTSAVARGQVEWLIEDSDKRSLKMTVLKVDQRYSSWQESGLISFNRNGANYESLLQKDGLVSEYQSVKWNAESGLGSLKIDEGDVLCWDANKLNATCP